jgi:hypothetical protein
MLSGRKLPGRSATKNITREALKQDDEAFSLGRNEDWVNKVVAGIIRDMLFRPQ